MTDRELLELAAKAAGIVQTGYVSEGQYHHAALLYDNEDDCSVRWNPLIDDGDAMRLACRLSADVFINQVTIRVEIGRIVVTQEISRGDKPAATRRAITRAAAEIGKQK